MPSRTSTKTPRRPPVTRERALRAAIVVADAEGISALTMRRLAHELGVEAMSLYHHVANKEDVLDGMVDLVFAEIELPVEGGSWRPEMERHARSCRDVLLRHRWAVGLMDSRRSPGPATLHHHDVVIGCCRRSGFSVRMAAHAISLLDSYVYGFVLQEVTLPFTDGDDLVTMVGEVLPDLDDGALPYLAELTAEVVLQPGYRYGDEFDFGLVLVLDGIEAAVDSASA